MRRIMILSLALSFSAAVWGQGPPKMRTRILTHMTNTEIEQYLKRNDVIFVPVGTVEPHAEMPIHAEYVGPLAYAIQLAEEGDGLVLSGILQALRDHDKFTQEHILPQYGWMFPNESGEEKSNAGIHQH